MHQNIERERERERVLVGEKYAKNRRENDKFIVRESE